jgi:hypothetical protein
MCARLAAGNAGGYAELACLVAGRWVERRDLRRVAAADSEQV